MFFLDFNGDIEVTLFDQLRLIKNYKILQYIPLFILDLLKKMPFTRQQSKDIFNHLVANVAFLQDVDPGFLALMQEGITNLSILLSLDASDVLTWYSSFADDAGTVTNKPLPKGKQYLLKHLVNFTQMHYTSTPSAQDSKVF